jgi:MICOS complex subunit MIC60
VVLPANETLSSERAPLVPDQHIPVPVVGADVPLTPPKPEVVARDVAGKDRPEPPASIDDVGESKVKAAKIPNPPPPPPPPAPKKKGFFRRLRNFVFTLLVLGAIGFSGGVWYSRINDRFHDFFTEYIPFGEEAVLYLEELEFKQRFPNAPKGSVKPREGAQIRVPAQSGASWRVADSEPSTRLSSAGPTSGATPATDATVKPDPPKVSPTEPVPAPKPKEEALPEAEPAPAPVKKTSKTPEVNEPSKAPPLQPIDLMSLADAREPVVQDLVHMLNDLILVINADGAHGKYGTTINKAKDDIKKVGGKLNALKDKIEKKSADEVKSKMQEFDAAATELVSRVEKAMANQEAQWRQEFEDEMKKVRESYDERVKLVLDREQKLSEQKLQNQLLEQAIALKKEFTAEVKSHVEAERDSRLGKLDELAAAVKELEDLSLGWNSVVDSNLKTQQLHVAVESVRAKLESATHPQPFIKELVALKEIAAEDSVVSSAIASINPSAYQRGIFTSSQLIDRFRKVAGEVRKASLLPDDAGVASHASSWVLSHVMFKKQGLPEGNDVESVLTRTQIFLEEGDLDAAAREMNGLEGWAKTLSKDWLLEVRKVLEVQQALDVSDAIHFPMFSR